MHQTLIIGKVTLLYFITAYVGKYQTLVPRKAKSVANINIKYPIPVNIKILDLSHSYGELVKILYLVNCLKDFMRMILLCWKSSILEGTFNLVQFACRRMILMSNQVNFVMLLVGAWSTREEYLQSNSSWLICLLLISLIAKNNINTIHRDKFLLMVEIFVQAIETVSKIFVRVTVEDH